MHRLCVRFATILVLLLPIAWLSPAGAGGPTSVLLSVPGERATASLYYTDPEYDALAELVGITGATGTGTPDTSGRSHERGPGVTVTWLIHDVMPWRVDRVYPSAKGEVWIATQVAAGSGSIWDSSVVWHRPESGTELMVLLDRLGVGEAARAAGDFNGVAGATPPEPPQPAGSDGIGTGSGEVADGPAAMPKDSTASADAGVWWGVAGLVAGLVVGVLAMLVVRRVPELSWSASRS